MGEFNVKNFLFSSSATVYGAPQYLPLDEKHPCIGDAITNPYGKSKYVCEHVLKDTAIAHPVRIEFIFSDRSLFCLFPLGLEYCNFTLFQSCWCS
jgi:UDP-glucose 4-epimerase